MVAMPVWQAVAWELRHGAGAGGLRRATGRRRRCRRSQRRRRRSGAAARHLPFRLRPPRARTRASRTTTGSSRTIGRFLAERGFYVAEASHSNYLKTAPSLASTFHMDYLDFLANDPRVEGENWHPIFEMLDDHRVARFLKARGYDVPAVRLLVARHLRQPARRREPSARLQRVRHALHAAAPCCGRSSMLLPDVPFTERLDWDNGQCQRVARQVEMIKAIGARERPVYVFAHFLRAARARRLHPRRRLPDFREIDGARRPAGLHRPGRLYRPHHRGPGDVAAGAGRTAPVILVQADEGPFPDRDYSVAWQDAPPDELRVKTGDHERLLLPERRLRLLRPDITPVNSYRAMFDTYFGAGLPAAARPHLRLPARRAALRVSTT